MTTKSICNSGLEKKKAVKDIIGKVMQFLVAVV